MYENYRMHVIEFDKTDVFGRLDLNGSQDDGGGSAGGSSYGGDDHSDM